MRHMVQTRNRDADGAEWVWSETYREHARVVERLELWDSPVCRIWLPNRDAIILVPESDITPITGNHGHALPGTTEAARIRYLLMAARLSNLITDDILLAPIDASVIPLPHQIKALRKAISRDKVRFLLADEVGLGKTIEAGLILRELKLRGLVNRTLVIVPRGLVTQWIAEMQTHFGEEFKFYSPADFPAYRRIAQSENVWQTGNQIICSLDSVKPVDARKGWTEEQLAQFNQDRFLDLISAGWDMIIVDEAHRLGGSSVQVARHQLGKGLAEAAPYLLLLSATPHQGKSDAFHRLLTLLDRTAFPDPTSVVKERVLPYVIRTEKRHAIDAGGKPLFQPRITALRGEAADIGKIESILDHRIRVLACTIFKVDEIMHGVQVGAPGMAAQVKIWAEDGFLCTLIRRLLTENFHIVISADHGNIAAQGKDKDECAESSEFAFESHLRDYLKNNLHIIEPGLKLDRDEEDSTITGVEFEAGGKRIDILAVDKDNNFAIIELKVSRGYEKVIGQILRYRAWVRKNLAGEQGIRGIIIAKVITDDLKLAASETKDIELFEYDLKMDLRKI